MNHQIGRNQIASQVPFDPAGSGLTSTNVQDAIEESTGQIVVSASPGFTWGKSGNVTPGSYLLNDTVPSNVAGRTVPVYNASITTIFIKCELASTATFHIQTRVGAVFTTIASVTLSNERTKTLDFPTPPSVNYNDEIAILTADANVRNPVVGIIIKGSVTP